MFLTAPKKMPVMEPAFFDALLVGFARSVIAFLSFDGGKTAVFSRREQGGGLLPEHRVK